MKTLSNFKLLVTVPAIAFSLAVALPSAQAEDLLARGAVPFASYDTDADGAISETELNAFRTARQAARTGDGALMQDAVPFASYDTDANGSISEAELDAFRTTRQAGWATDGAPMRGQGNSPAFDDFNQGGSGNRLGQDEAQDSVWGAQADGDGFGGRGQGGGHGGGSGQGHGGRGR